VLQLIDLVSHNFAANLVNDSIGLNLRHLTRSPFPLTYEIDFVIPYCELVRIRLPDFNLRFHPSSNTTPVPVLLKPVKSPVLPLFLSYFSSCYFFPERQKTSLKNRLLWPEKQVAHFLYRPVSNLKQTIASFSTAS